jgi:predicted alpha/beta hydrolase family esterase
MLRSLHEHFYEGHLNEELFKERWNEVVELFEKTRRMIYEEFQL